MADKRSDLQGNPQDFETDSGTAKLERKKVLLGKDAPTEDDPEAVQTQELRQQMKATLRKDAPKEGAEPGDEMTQDLTEGVERPGTERVVKKTTLKLAQSGTNKLTESRRMLRPTGARQPTDSKKMLRPKSLAGMSDSSRLQRPRSTAQMNEEEKIQTQELLPHEMDPSRRRETDTANLKRIRPGKTSAEGVTAGGETGTDTIHLRVIKEKKNQLKNILSASQTIRLRPSPSDAGATAKETPAPSADAKKSETGTEPTQKRTLKIKAPTAGSSPGTAQLKKTDVKTEDTEPRTAMVNRDDLAKSGTEVPTQLKRKAPTLQPRKDGGAKTDTVKLKAPTRPATQDAPGKATLKIKAPPTAQPQPAVPTTETAKVSTGKSTLKIKAPVTAGGAGAPKITQRAPAPGAQTVKQQAPATSGGKTLKLKAAPKSAAKTAAEPADTPAPQTKAAAAPAAQPAAAVRQGDQPGILYTLGSVAAVLVIVAGVAISGMSYYDLFMQ